MIELFEGQGVYFIRIALACICGAIIGIERQQRTKVAGIRTHIMISLAATLMMIISKYGFADVAGANGLTCDVSRVAAGIITGIGILGGGIIFTGKQGSVSGITTAAGVWVTIGIGMALGAGLYVLGIGSMLMVVFIQLLLHTNLWITKQPFRVQVVFRVEDPKEDYEKILNQMNTHKITVGQVKWERKGKNSFHIRCQVVIPAHYTRDEITSFFMTMHETETFEMIQ